MSQSQSQIPKVGDEFLTVESFKEAAQQSAKAAGFAFSVSSSKVSGGGKGGHTPFIVLQCVMGGKYRNNHQITEETRKRKKSTKRQNCPVNLRAVLNKDAKVWVVTISKNEHNHELLLPSQVHCLPQHRYLTTEQKELVHIMLKTTLLHKIEELATEEIPVPKAPLHTVSNKHPTSTKRDPLL
ncbi:13122_t:CDS:2, partial [Racocetra fulgida]